MSFPLAHIYRGGPWPLIGTGSAFLLIIVFEIMNRKRPISRVDQIGSWLARLFVASVGVLMILAGLHYLGIETLWRR
jgi:hypothetical protein